MEKGEKANVYTRLNCAFFGVGAGSMMGLAGDKYMPS